MGDASVARGTPATVHAEQAKAAISTTKGVFSNRLKRKMIFRYGTSGNQAEPVSVVPTQAWDPISIAEKGLSYRGTLTLQTVAAGSRW
jgi:hypothetical protein